MKERRNISSADATLFYKFIFPLLTVLASAAGGAVFLLNWHQAREMWFLPLVWLLALGWVFWFSYNLKFVSLDERFFYISGYGREVREPIAAVQRVEVSLAMRPKLVTLWLRGRSGLMEAVVFVPEQRAFEGVREGHPLVEELRAMLREHGSVDRPRQT